MLLVVADALRVGAVQRGVEDRFLVLRHPVRRVVLPFHQAHDQRHAHELAVLHLAEIGRARVVVHLGQDLVDARQRVQHGHLLLGERHAAGVQHEAVLHPVEFVLVQEALLLHARHIEHVQLRDGLVEVVGLAVGHAHLVADILLDVVRQAQLVRGDQHDLDALVARQGLDQGVDGPAEAEVAAESDGDAVDVPEFPLDRQEVRQGLRRVAVGAVAGVDDGHGRYFRGIELGTLDVVAHGDDVGEAAHHADGVLHGLALAHRSVLGVGETEHVAAQLHHRGGETQPRAGAGLIEERSELLVGHAALVAFAVRDDVFGQRDDLVDLLLGEVGGVDEVFHKLLRKSRICCFWAGVI